MPRWPPHPIPLEAPSRPLKKSHELRARAPGTAVGFLALVSKHLGQCPHFAGLVPQPPTSVDRVGGVAAMLVVAVARPLGPALIRAHHRASGSAFSRSRQATGIVFPTCLGATPRCLSQR